MYSIGYEGGPESGHTPTIKRGLLSRFHRWDPIRTTFVETDSVAAGGLSGGALVSETGAVIGVIQFGFPTASMAASATDVISRASRLLAGEDINGLGDRSLLGGQARTSWSVTLGGRYDERSFVFDAPESTQVTVTAVGSGDGFVAAARADGAFLDFSDEDVTGSESLVFTADGMLPTIVTIGQFSAGSGRFTVSASGGAALYEDPDDGRGLEPGAPVIGHLDYVGDIDHYVFDLAEGETATLSVDSISFDPVIWIDEPTNDGVVLAMDDDSGGGLLGLSSEATFVAPATGRYVLVTDDLFGELGGAYVVRLDSFSVASVGPATGTIVSGVVPRQGLGLFVFGGGTNEQLVEAAGCAPDRARFFVLVEGEWVLLIPAAPPAVNARWSATFQTGIPANTVILGSCNERAA